MVSMAQRASTAGARQAARRDEAGSAVGARDGRGEGLDATGGSEAVHGP
jgi:hypothetical protein